MESTWYTIWFRLGSVPDIGLHWSQTAQSPACKACTISLLSWDPLFWKPGESCKNANVLIKLISTARCFSSRNSLRGITHSIHSPSQHFERVRCFLQLWWYFSLLYIWIFTRDSAFTITYSALFCLKLLYHGLTAGASASCSKSLSIFHSNFQYSALLDIVSCPLHYHSENIIGQHLRFWHWLSLTNEALVQFDFVVGKYCQLCEPVAKQVCG